MDCCPRKARRERLERCRRRLDLYYEQEARILEGGVRAYGIGSRNLQRYDADLASVRAAIKDLEAEVAELEAGLCGRAARKAVAVVPRDW